MKTKLSTLIVVLLIAFVAYTEQAIHVTFGFEFSKAPHEKEKIEVVKKYISIDNDKLRRTIYYNCLSWINEPQYCQEAYQLLQNAGMNEFAYEFLTAKGINNSLCNWAVDELLKLNDEQLKKALGICGLFQVTGVDFKNNPSCFRKWIKTVRKALPNLDRSDEATLRKCVLQEKDSCVRLFALYVLNVREEKNTESIIPLFVDLFGDEDKMVSESAKNSLCGFSSLQQGEKYDYSKWKDWLKNIHKYLPSYELSTNQELMKAFKDGDTGVRSFAITLLANRAFFGKYSNASDMEIFFSSIVKSGEDKFKDKAKDAIEQMGNRETYKKNMLQNEKLKSE